MTTDRPKIDKSKLKRTRPPMDDEEEVVEEQRVSNPVDKVIDLAFNPTRDKIREVTIIDRVQGRLFPLLDTINYMRSYCLEVAQFRQSPTEYRKIYRRDKPSPPQPLDEFMYRTAQWSKSVAGRNLEKATDIALAETEVKGSEEEEFGRGGDAWKE